jgi:hypothetical protein
MREDVTERTKGQKKPTEEPGEVLGGLVSVLAGGGRA